MTTGNMLRQTITPYTLLLAMVYSLFAFAPQVAGAAQPSKAIFAPQQTFANDEPIGRAIAAVDMNKDGYKDIVFVSGGHTGGKNFIYFNDGSGSFSDARRIQFGENETFKNSEAVAVRDLDNDGYPDVLVGNSSVKDDPALRGKNVESYLYKNKDGESLELVYTFTLGKGGARSVAFADLDGDGNQDVMIGVPVKNYLAGNTKTIWFYRNLGGFNFEFYNNLVLPKLDTGKNSTLVTTALATVDVNGATNGWGRLKYLISGNRGDWVDDNSTDTRGSIATNQDKHPSAVFENTSSGTPAFTLKASFGAIYQTTGIALGDVNGDNHWDIATGHGGEPESAGGLNYVYLNNGSNQFSDSNANISVGTQAESSRPVAMADVNGDGKMDIAVGNQGTLGNGRAIEPRTDPSYLYYYNTGSPTQPYTGTFTTQILNGETQLRDLTLADMNNDGLLDIVGAVSCIHAPNTCQGAFVMLQLKASQ